MNKIVLTGNCGNEPEQKTFDSGAVLTKFNIAVAHWNSKKKENETHWLKVQTFSKLGSFLHKGNKVGLEGELLTSVWETDKGEKRKDIYIQADTIEIYTPKDKEVTQEVEDCQEVFDDEVPF